MRALAVAVTLLWFTPFAAADHAGCQPDVWIDLGVVELECQSAPHRDGTMYSKRVEVDLDEADVYDARVVFEQRHSTATNASTTCRVYVYGPTQASYGNFCPGAHHDLVP